MLGTVVSLLSFNSWSSVQRCLGQISSWSESERSVIAEVELSVGIFIAGFVPFLVVRYSKDSHAYKHTDIHTYVHTCIHT